MAGGDRRGEEGGELGERSGVVGVAGMAGIAEWGCGCGEQQELVGSGQEAGGTGAVVARGAKDGREWEGV
eukprot:scaffold296824_cov29-Tisochrysis_lutea.AAC.2